MPKGIYPQGSTKKGGMRLQKQIATGKKLKKTGTSSRSNPKAKPSKRK